MGKHIVICKSFVNFECFSNRLIALIRYCLLNLEHAIFFRYSICQFKFQLYLGLYVSVSFFRNDRHVKKESTDQEALETELHGYIYLFINCLINFLQKEDDTKSFNVLVNLSDHFPWNNMPCIWTKFARNYQTDNSAAATRRSINSGNHTSRND